MDETLLEAHVERFNAAVRSGDYEPMLAAFAPDAEMAFEGAPAGPFTGRDAIAAAYAATPPTDEVRLLGSVRKEDGATVADYAWAADGVRAGRMLLSARDGLITRLVVTFEPPLLRPLTEADVPVVERLWQLYSHDMSEVPRDVAESGGPLQAGPACHVPLEPGRRRRVSDLASRCSGGVRVRRRALGRAAAHG